MNFLRRGTDPCPAETKLRAWLADGARDALTLKPGDFAGQPFSLTTLLFSAPLPERLRQYWRSFCAWMGSHTPLSGWKVFWYRRAGVTIGKNVFISPWVMIDLLFPQLITLEDEAVLGLGAIIVAHVFSPDRILVGRSHVGRRALVGGRSILPVNQIGEEGVLGANSWPIVPIPARHIAIGVPPQIYERKISRTGKNGENPV
jgi:acetyltransferase-like isoleucine patch superfamily enzyme